MLRYGGLDFFDDGVFVASDLFPYGGVNLGFGKNRAGHGGS
jgi:hypothetical protein